MRRERRESESTSHHLSSICQSGTGSGKTVSSDSFRAQAASPDHGVLSVIGMLQQLPNSQLFSIPPFRVVRGSKHATKAPFNVSQKHASRIDVALCFCGIRATAIGDITTIGV